MLAGQMDPRLETSKECIASVLWYSAAGAGTGWILRSCGRENRGEEIPPLTFYFIVASKTGTEIIQGALSTTISLSNEEKRQQALTGTTPPCLALPLTSSSFPLSKTFLLLNSASTSQGCEIQVNTLALNGSLEQKKTRSKWLNFKSWAKKRNGWAKKIDFQCHKTPHLLFLVRWNLISTRKVERVSLN